MSSDRKSKEKSKKRSVDSQSEDEIHAKRHKTRDDYGEGSRKRDKKDKSHHSKHSKRHSGKEKKSEKKHKTDVSKSDIKEISNDGYFAKNNEFATWLKEDKDKPIEESCTHPGFLKDMCIGCGKRMDDRATLGAGIAFKYIHEDLRLNIDEISRLRNADVRTLLRHKKLYLVLDLDHTLLNSPRLDDLSSEEEYLMSQTDSLKDISKGSLFRLDMICMMTKLRPFIRTFLQEASNMFEMYIYTMGERHYALEMANLLDPGGLYFNSRIISQADCTQRHQKGLDVVLGVDTAVLILDDTEAVWQKHKDNLILMDRYHYFSSSCRQFGFHCKSLSELKSDENEADGSLATVLGVLKKIHGLFFDPEREDDFAARDVRQVLKQIRKEILKDCKIAFSRVFPMKFQAAHHHLWKMAEQLGATCSVEVDSSVTHVVSTDSGTEKSRWAVQNGKFLVYPNWLEASNYLWMRQPEEQFPVQQRKSK